MLAINANYLPIFQAILMILVSKCMVYRVFSDKTYLSLGLLSRLRSSMMSVTYNGCCGCSILGCLSRKMWMWDVV